MIGPVPGLTGTAAASPPECNAQNVGNWYYDESRQVWWQCREVAPGVFDWRQGDPEDRVFTVPPGVGTYKKYIGHTFPIGTKTYYQQARQVEDNVYSNITQTSHG